MENAQRKREPALIRLWPDIGRDELGLSRTAAYDLANRGEIPCVRVGRRMYVPANWLSKYRASEVAA